MKIITRYFKLYAYPLYLDDESWLQWGISILRIKRTALFMVTDREISLFWLFRCHAPWNMDWKGIGKMLQRMFTFFPLMKRFRDDNRFLLFRFRTPSHVRCRGGWKFSLSLHKEFFWYRTRFRELRLTIGFMNIHFRST